MTTTRRRRKKEALDPSVEERLARLAAIVESSDDAIVGKDLDGTIRDWNPGAERLFGYSREEVIGRPILMLLPPERREEETHILQTLLRGEQIDHFETERVRKNGVRIQVSISVSPIRDRNGRVIGAAKIARDIGARKAIEAERERLLAQERAERERADAANRAKDAFLATVSHELRTPLSPLLTWSRLLITGHVAGEKARRAYEVIERNARAQAQLVDDLLDVSRIVSGKLRLEVRPVNLAPVIEAAIDTLRPAAAAKDIRISTVLDTETTISGDPTRLQQVVWNLLSNAVKFTPRGGQVQLVLERVDSHVEIAVSDTGQGIQPEFLPHVFERFRQADASTTRVQGGLGLGLAIVRHIVELHGGTVHAESPGDGQGAVFTVKLPLMIVARKAGEEERRHPTLADLPPKRSDISLEGFRVVVVDDEPDSCEAVQELLSSAGAEVRVAGSASQGLEVLERWKPDILITDIGMPEEDGYSLLARVRALDADQRDVPAIALTAYATTQDRVRLLSWGFESHVPKPVEPSELLAVVAAALRTHRSSPR